MKNASGDNHDLGPSLDRRAFLKATMYSCLAPCALAVARPSSGGILPVAGAAENDSQFIVEAKFYEKLPYKKDQVQALPARMRD